MRRKAERELRDGKGDREKAEREKGGRQEVEIIMMEAETRQR